MGAETLYYNRAIIKLTSLRSQLEYWNNGIMGSGKVG